ncbi:MAG: homocysteine S-methyltransferase family protein [Eubacterium sp.]|nr:homocysteine S-methyltransferase family protein [Eubacterium sp.]
MKKFRERLGKERLYCDGGTGSVLQAKGLKGGELPERWNLTRPEDIIDLARGYFAAGSDIVNTNTFGANRLHYPDPEELRAIIEAAVHHVKEGRRLAGREDGFAALDIGPTGRLLKPMGDLDFEEAVSIFAEVVRIGARAGADLILIETMSDTLETKAAVLAAKENSDLPVCVTTVYDEKGKMLTGGTVETVVPMLEGLRVDALGLNCSLGPRQMLPIAKKLAETASIPVICNPNAGLPRMENGQTVYDLTADEFAEAMREIASCGIQVLGGCCGTTPEYIRKTIAATRDLPFQEQTKKNRTVVTSYSKAVEIARKPVIIGERINPTGKKRFKQALRDNDLDYILEQAFAQEAAGADLLDVNVGLPEIDEPQMMARVITELQSVMTLPLQIDTSDAEALERGLRCYNGKPMINSVNGKQESLDTVLPLVAKYGGVVVGLTLDENGIPDTADGRIAIASRIFRAAAGYGIPKEDVIIDGLAMTVSTDTGSALTTLETIRRVREELDGHTILGVSNISFGLPQREIVNATFFALAMQNGLSCAIINPNNTAMMAAYRAYLALSDLDPQCQDYISAYADKKDYAFGLAPKQVPAKGGSSAGGCVPGTAGGCVPGTAGRQGANAAGKSAGQDAAANTAQTSDNGSVRQDSGSKESSLLAECILKGRAERAAAEAEHRIAEGADPLDLVNRELIPALDRVGQGFEKGTIFLPQLLMSAEAAGAAFEIVKQSLSNTVQEVKGRIILATVKGDIHDIGKNIVKVLLENYGYEVLDLGKDVPPEEIVKTAIEEDIPLIGLSALMTTTVVSMEETIRLLREQRPETKVVVGGAVMTQDYADSIGADKYAKEAMDTVRYADAILGSH